MNLLCLAGVARCWFFFFFQAEDGIRDYKVTGVQTCAFPIWVRVARRYDAGLRRVAPRIRPTRAARQERQRRIGRYVRVALAPPSEAQPQVRERRATHELLLTDVPGPGQPREERPLVPCRELGRAVIAQHARHEELVLEPVVGPGKERDKAALFRRRGIRPRDGGAQVVEAERVGEVALAL